ncbi:MAG: hypothetical protein SPL77_02825 [Prevotella sp.]|nr:hypothetical protein [Prevotella sp.]
MTEKVGTAALAVAQGKDGHREGDLLTRYTQLDLAPVKLALLAGLIILLDEHILGLATLLRLALLDVLANARIADAEALLYQGTVDVLPLQALLPHASLPALRILREQVLNLCTDGICQFAAPSLAWRIIRPAGQAYVSTLFRVRRYLSLILTDVAGHGLTVKTNPAGNLPQTQTINAMVMKNLFFFVHVDHFYSLYVKQHSCELLL